MMLDASVGQDERDVRCASAKNIETIPPPAGWEFAVCAAILPKFINKNAINTGLTQGSRTLVGGLAEPGPDRRSGDGFRVVDPKL